MTERAGEMEGLGPRDVRSVRVGRSPDATAMQLVQASVVAAAGPAAWAWQTGSVRSGLLVAGVLIGLTSFDRAAVGAGRRGRSASLVVVSVAAWTVGTIALVLLGGPRTAAWGLATSVVARWAVLGQPPRRGLPAAADAATPVTVLSLAAAIAAIRSPAGDAALVLTSAMCVVTVVSALLGDRWTSALATFGRGVGRVVSVVVFAAVSVVIVLVPWAAQRLFAVDPVRHRSQPGWSRSTRDDLHGDRPWARDRVRHGSSRFERVRWTLHAPVSALAAIAIVIGASASIRTAPAPVDGLPAWWSDYQAELDWAIAGPSGARSASRFPPMTDVHGRFINVVDGRRTTWTPPPCECRRLRVWVYGGSTVLGWGQRDDHTIPSELARLAYARGVVLDVENRGVAGDLNWQAGERFTWDLAVGPAPDLVVFYDGYNDLRAAFDLNGDRSVGYSTEWPTDWKGTERTDAPFALDLLRSWLAPPPAGAGQDETEVAPLLDPATLGRAVVENYDRGRSAVVAVAAERSVPVIWFWQPDLHTAPRGANEGRPPPADDEAQRAQRTAARQALAPDVIDLGDALDDEVSVYLDDVHTTERGARLIAERILASAAPTLRANADGGG